MLWTRTKATPAFLCAFLLVLGCGRKPADIHITQEHVDLTRLGASDSVRAEVLDKKGRPLRDCRLIWTSSDPSVAEVVGEGVIVAKGKGVARVSISCGVASNEISVNVVPIGSIRVIPETSTLFRIGATRSMEVEVLDEAGKPVEGLLINWSSMNPGVASTNDSGMVTAVSGGDTKVTARVMDREVSANVTIRPVDLPDKLASMIRKCLTCNAGSQCKVAVRDESFFYLLEIVDGDLRLSGLVENEGQSVWDIDKELSKRGMEICRGVWVYGGKFGTGMANWAF